MVTENNAQGDGNTCFLRAARAGNLERVLEHLKNNININTSNANGLNALHLASKDGHIHVVSELLRRGAIVDSATNKGNTALHIASLAGQEEVVKMLLDHGASVNVQSQNGFTPLYMAAQENHDSVVKLLLANGANQSLATEDGFTPLAVAMQQGHDKVVAVLLESDTRGKVRLPALHIAAKKDDVKAATLLLDNDHNPDVTSKSGFTPLHIASHYGNQAVANLLIQKGADVNYSAKHNINPLHVAAKWGKANMVSLLLEKGAIIEAKTRDGLTPLHCAARSGHEQVVDMLLERGAPISAKTKNGLAPLHMAAQGEHVDAARILLYHRAPVDEVTVDYLTALHVAAHCGHVRVAKLLLDRNADANARALNGFTPLHIACKKNRIKVVELLLRHGASISATTESGLTPLHVAAFMGCMNIVIYLLQHDASPDVPTVRGETPLHLAARANQTDIIRILLRNGAQVDARAREQQTPLHIASRLGNVDIVMLLLQHSAQVDATTKDMYTALHIAAKEGQDEVAAVLIENGAALDAATKKGFTPLHLAAKYGHSNVAQLLLQKEACVDAKGKNGVTPLHVACHYNNQNVALLLLENGASPHATAKNGHSTLHIVARKNQMDIATTLLEYGAQANAESKAGFTPLHLACQGGHAEMCNLFIEHKANVNHPAKNGLTPMHLCAQEDNVHCAEILHRNGANIDMMTKAGYTPLHVAAHFGQANMVRFLLQKMANVDAATSIGYTPLHQTAQQGHCHIVNLLLEHKANVNAQTANGQTPLHIARKLGYISVLDSLKSITNAEDDEAMTVSDEKYRVVAPEAMHESFMSDSEEEGGEDNMLSDQPYRYLTVDEMKSLGDDSLPIDVTRDERVDSNRITQNVEYGTLQSQQQSSLGADNICPHKAQIHGATQDQYDSVYMDSSLQEKQQFVGRKLNWKSFLVSFLVDARGGAMRGCRHSGVRMIIPSRSTCQPTRVTCRYVKPQRTMHPPQLMEGEALASRVLELGPITTKFIGPVVMEVPHFASLRGKEREIIILRSDNGETWREHIIENSEEIIQNVLQQCFEPEEIAQLEEQGGNRVCRFVTYDFPQYFAVVSRIRQEVHAIGPEGGMVSSTVVPQVQAVFPQGALTKKIKVGLQAQPVDSDLTAKLLGRGVAVSPIVTVEPRRRKFHKAITLSMPAPKAHSQGMVNQYSGGNTPTLRLLCSITGGPSRAQWEDVTGSTPLTFVNDCVSFTTTVSARFWLMDCRNISDATKMATELYKEVIHVPFLAKFVVFAKKVEAYEARLRVFCMTDDREVKTLEKQELYTEVAKSRDVEVLEGKPQYVEMAGNLLPVTKSGEQLQLQFKAFRENRLPFTVRVKDQHADIVGRTLFMKEPKVAKGEPPQHPICILNIVLPENVIPDSTTSFSDKITTAYSTSLYRLNKHQNDQYIGDMRIVDLSNLLGSDWIQLAPEIGITIEESNNIISQYPDSIARQAQNMIRLYRDKPNYSVNTLENALQKIQREDIIKRCKSACSDEADYFKTPEFNDKIARAQQESKHIQQINEHEEVKYSAEEKEVEESESDEDTSKRTVAERREKIVKRLSIERQIPASSQKKEITREIIEIKRKSLIEDKKAIHESEIMMQLPADNIVKSTVAPEQVMKIKMGLNGDTTDVSKTDFEKELSDKFSKRSSDDYEDLSEDRTISETESSKIVKSSSHDDSEKLDEIFSESSRNVDQGFKKVIEDFKNIEKQQQIKSMQSFEQKKDIQEKAVKKSEETMEKKEEIQQSHKDKQEKIIEISNKFEDIQEKTLKQMEKTEEFSSSLEHENKKFENISSTREEKISSKRDKKEKIEEISSSLDKEKSKIEKISILSREEKQAKSTEISTKHEDEKKKFEEIMSKHEEKKELSSEVTTKHEDQREKTKDITKKHDVKEEKTTEILTKKEDMQKKSEEHLKEHEEKRDKSVEISTKKEDKKGKSEDTFKQHVEKESIFVEKSLREDDEEKKTEDIFSEYKTKYDKSAEVSSKREDELRKSEDVLRTHEAKAEKSFEHIKKSEDDQNKSQDVLREHEILLDEKSADILLKDEQKQEKIKEVSSKQEGKVLFEDFTTQPQEKYVGSIKKLENIETKTVEISPIELAAKREIVVETAEQLIKETKQSIEEIFEKGTQALYKHDIKLTKNDQKNLENSAEKAQEISKDFVEFEFAKNGKQTTTESTLETQIKPKEGSKEISSVAEEIQKHSQVDSKTLHELSDYEITGIHDKSSSEYQTKPADITFEKSVESISPMKQTESCYKTEETERRIFRSSSPPSKIDSKISDVGKCLSLEATVLGVTEAITTKTTQKVSTEVEKSLDTEKCDKIIETPVPVEEFKTTLTTIEKTVIGESPAPQPRTVVSKDQVHEEIKNVTTDVQVHSITADITLAPVPKPRSQMTTKKESKDLGLDDINLIEEEKQFPVKPTVLNIVATSVTPPTIDVALSKDTKITELIEVEEKSTKFYIGESSRNVITKTTPNKETSEESFDDISIDDRSEEKETLKNVEDAENKIIRQGSETRNDILELEQEVMSFDSDSGRYQLDKSEWEISEKESENDPKQSKVGYGSVIHDQQLMDQALHVAQTSLNDVKKELKKMLRPDEPTSDIESGSGHQVSEASLEEPAQSASFYVDKLELEQSLLEQELQGTSSEYSISQYDSKGVLIFTDSTGKKLDIDNYLQQTETANKQEGKTESSGTDSQPLSLQDVDESTSSESHYKSLDKPESQLFTQPNSSDYQTAIDVTSTYHEVTEYVSALNTLDSSGKTLSSHDSMRSLDSQSEISANLGTMSVSELTETLVASSTEAEAIDEADEIDQECELPDDDELDKDDSDYSLTEDQIEKSMMKRSKEMIFKVKSSETTNDGKMIEALVIEEYAQPHEAEIEDNKNIGTIQTVNIEEPKDDSILRIDDDKKDLLQTVHIEEYVETKEAEIFDKLKDTIQAVIIEEPQEVEIIESTMYTIIEHKAEDSKKSHEEYLDTKEVEDEVKKDTESGIDIQYAQFETRPSIDDTILASSLDEMSVLSASMCSNDPFEPRRSIDEIKLASSLDEGSILSASMSSTSHIDTVVENIDDMIGSAGSSLTQMEGFSFRHEDESFELEFNRSPSDIALKHRSASLTSSGSGGGAAEEISAKARDSKLLPGFGEGKESESESDTDPYESEYARQFRSPIERKPRKKKQAAAEIDHGLELEKRPFTPSQLVAGVIVEDADTEQLEEEEAAKQEIRRPTQNMQNYANIPDITVTTETPKLYDDKDTLEEETDEFQEKNLYKVKTQEELHKVTDESLVQSPISTSIITATSTVVVMSTAQMTASEEKFQKLVQEQYKQKLAELHETNIPDELQKSDSPDSFEVIEQPDITDEFVIVEEVAKEANEVDLGGQIIKIQPTKRVSKHDEEVEQIIIKSAPADPKLGSQIYRDDLNFEFEESPPTTGSGSEAQEESDSGDMTAANKRWVEMQLADNQMRYPYDISSGVLEDIKEEDAEFEVGSSRISSFKDSFSSTPEYDNMTSRRQHGRGEHVDNISMSSLQEFESLEQAISLENRNKMYQGSTDSSSGSFPRRYMARHGGRGDNTQGDDISVSSLKEFEGLESACLEATLIEIKAKEEAALLSRSDESNKSSGSDPEAACPTKLKQTQDDKLVEHTKIEMTTVVPTQTTITTVVTTSSNVQVSSTPAPEIKTPEIK